MVTRMGADVAYRSCWSRRSPADRSSRGVRLHDPYTLRSYGVFLSALQGDDAAAREAARLLQNGSGTSGDALTRRTAAN